ncbi:phospholipase A2 inhibitor and Ly6/PLAUR domain-containing protein-like [Lissotriton helveticus]
MWVFFTTVIFLASVINEGSSLTCERCLSVDNTSCSGSLKLCRKGVTHCVSGLRNKTTGPKVKITAFKGCVKPAKQVSCDKEVVVTSTDGSMQISRKCCDSDKCNQIEIEVPPVNVTENGYKCPTCSLNNSANECKPVDDLLCVGMADQCATYTRTSHKKGKPVKKLSIKGCATMDACDGGHFNIASSKTYQYDAKCIPSNKV